MSIYPQLFEPFKRENNKVKGKEFFCAKKP